MELGAATIWDKNLYMRDATERMGLKAVPRKGSSGSGFAVYNGQRFVSNKVKAAFSD
jgi:hypothetical protein